MDTGPSAESGDVVPVQALGAVPALALPAQGETESLLDRPPHHQALLLENWREPGRDVH